MELLTSSAAGIGIATHAGTAPDAPILDVWYPAPALAAEPPAVPHLADACGEDPLRGVVTRPVTTTIADLSAPPTDVADAYLRLHLLSHRLVAPRTINLDGVFGVLPNVAWTSLGPVAIESLVRGPDARPGRRGAADGAQRGQVPADGRLRRALRGAHRRRGPSAARGPPGRGHHGHARGVLQLQRRHPRPLDGRGPHPAGVVVGAGSDIGGGASIMGTLSGGGREQVTIGEGALIGANGGIGISLGDRSVVEAGCYVTAGSKVRLPDGEVVKGRELSGRGGPAVPAQLDDRRPGGHTAHGPLGRPGRAPARQRLTQRCGQHRRLRRMRAVAIVVLGLSVGLAGAALQTHATTVGALTLPTGALLVLACIVPISRACAWWVDSRWGAVVFALAWLGATMAMATTSPGGDLVISSGNRQVGYLVGGSLLLAAACAYPLLSPLESGASAHSDA